MPVMTPSSSFRISARLAPLGLAVVLLTSACVNIAPIQTASPTPAAPSPTQSGQPNATPLPTPGGPTTAPATPGPTLEPGATPTPPPPDSSAPPVDPAVAAEIDAVVQQMPPIRELQPLTEVPYEFTTREQFIADITELQFSEVPEETRAAEERFYKRVGLLPDDADIDQLLLDLYGGQVAAYYRPDTKRFYVITDNQDPFSASDKVAVSHEYTHALQDQHFDLEGNRIKDLTQNDAVLAQLGAVEGDATKAMQLWTEQNLSPDEAFELLLESLQQLQDPTLGNTPWILRRQLEFPYAEGFAFVDGLYQQGGWDAVNASLSTAIPASTEQVLHPEKYLANEAPVVIDLPDESSEMNEGEGSWSLVYQQTMGELLMQVLVAGEESPPETIPGLPMTWPNAESVAGWGGDRLNMYESSEGGWLIEWHSTWDTETDATEFEARITAISPMFDGATTVTRTGSDVVVRITPDGSGTELPPV